MARQKVTQIGFPAGELDKFTAQKNKEIRNTYRKPARSRTPKSLLVGVVPKPNRRARGGG